MSTQLQITEIGIGEICGWRGGEGGGKWKMKFPENAVLSTSAKKETREKFTDE